MGTETDTILPLQRLSRAEDHGFDLRPGAETRTALAGDLGLDALRKLRLAGTLMAQGKRDWRLEATLGATVVQPCVATGAPVTTRIDAALSRRYVADLPEPEADDTEIPEDDSVESLPAQIDLSALMAEALALELPLYPRADDVEPVAAQFAAPGVVPMTDEDAKPLAGLASLRDQLAAKSDPDGDA